MNLFYNKIYEDFEQKTGLIWCEKFQNMIKYLFFSLIFIFILLNNVYAESNSEDICTQKNTKNKIININKDVIFCYGPEGLTIKHFENSKLFICLKRNFEI